MNKCVAFNMKDAKEALRHIRNNWEFIEDYGDEKYGHFLFTCDDGKRILGKCKKCDQLFLLQKSEYHDFSGGDDSYYSDYFAVSSVKEADELNRQYNGDRIEFDYDKKWLCVSDGEAVWKNDDKE